MNGAANFRGAAATHKPDSFAGCRGRGASNSSSRAHESGDSLVYLTFELVQFVSEEYTTA